MVKLWDDSCYIHTSGYNKTPEMSSPLTSMSDIINNNNNYILAQAVVSDCHGDNGHSDRAGDGGVDDF